MIKHIHGWMAFVGLVSACSIASAEAATQYSVRRIPSSQIISRIPDGSIADFRLALERQLANCTTKNQQEVFLYGTTRVTRKQMCGDTLNRLIELTRTQPDFQSIYNIIKTEFTWFESVGSDGQGTVSFTGYYFPHIDAVATPRGEYQYAMYRRPPEVIQVVSGGKTTWRHRRPDGTLAPYYTRGQIDFGNAIRGRGHEIAYVKDPFESFIFHVQGAGSISIRHDDGTVERKILNYDGANGHPYVSTRTILKNRGITDEFTLTIPGQKIYFEQNPDQLEPILTQTPSYVFFKEGNEGPYGVENIVLTPGHSLAIDPKALPQGTFAFIESARPDAVNSPTQVPFSRFALTQDVGGAIKTAGRIDFYWGEDSYAIYTSGVMNTPGKAVFGIKLK